MTHQLCVADHRDSPPTALGGLKLCGGHHAALTEALTGPSAAEDPTIDAVWGVDVGWGVYVLGDRASAYASALARSGCKVVCGDGVRGTGWWPPRDYRPGGLARDYTALTLRMTGQTTGDRLPSVSGSTEPKLPVPDGIAEARSQIRHDVAWWAARHAAESNTTAPLTSEPAFLIAWLAIYRDWAAAQDWAGDYVAVLGELRARAQRLIDLPRAPRAPVAQCPEHGCDGTLWSTIRPADAPRMSELTCDSCDKTWNSDQWMSLGRRLAGQTGQAA